MNVLDELLKGIFTQVYQWFWQELDIVKMHFSAEDLYG